MNPEKTMKKCQIGSINLNAANDLHAECYGTIGAMLNWIMETSEQYNICTKHITGNICPGCKQQKES